MKIVNCRRSELNDNVMIAEVKCSNCGHVTTVTCSAITELRTCVCGLCGNVDFEEKDGKTYKEAEKAMEKFKKVGKKSVGFRSGTERIVRTYYNAVQKGIVDLNAFPDKESFTVWSIQHGYRDWKTVKPSINGLIDTNARWEVSGYGTKGVIDIEKIEDELEMKNLVAKSVGVATSEMEVSIAKAMTNLDKIVEKCEILKQDDDTSEMKYRLLRIQDELKSIEKELDERFI